MIKTAIENLNEQAEQNYDYSDLMDEFLALKENPVNINSKESEKLIPLFLLDELQYQNLRQYIDSNGLLQSKNELLLVDGFSISNIQNLAPFIKAEKITQQNYPKPSKVLKYGRHQVFLRYQRALQNTQGYQGRNDSVWNSNPNSKYLGNADKYYFKYKFNYSDRISAGLVAEKDAGEIFFEDINNPTLDSLIGDKIQKGFDFYAAHLYIQHFGIIKQAVVGDYHLLFGQGLNMWSSLAFGKSSNAINIQRYGRDIKPNSSTDENKFLRGAAVNLAKNKWNLIVFYSSKNQDASDLSENGSQEEHYLSSINGTGFHRTVNELLKKNAVNVQLYGARIQYRHSLFKIGLTASHTQLDKAILPKTTAYQYYQFSGKINNIVGADYEFRLLQMNIYGEFSYQLQGGWAFMSGLNAPLSSRFALALLYRNYQKDYQNLYAAAFGENSQNNNEEGLFMGFNFQVAQKIKMNAYADIFRFPWLKFRVDAPTYGSEYMTQIDYDYSREVQMYVKLRYKNKAINTSDDSTPLGRVEEQTKYSIRYHISYKLHPLFTLKNRIEYQVYKTPSQGAQPGFLIFQDIQYKSKNQKLGLTARFALFDVDDYDSRIYAYENDLLYVFSVPAYYNRGIRAYGLMSYKVSDKIQFWFKIANTWYENKEEISSGLNLIKGSHKTEIRGQLRIKI
ncbi:MAG: hypothetical protein B7C24_01105 [Bacteroidetes bacterium 4572_77]|nr:MAG: hypothetical protein B7C24_01105 [Bacteroidetes bacterium 4572_77]